MQGSSKQKKDQFSVTPHVYEHTHQVFEHARSNTSSNQFFEMDSLETTTLHSKLVQINNLNVLKDKMDLPEDFFQGNSVGQIPDVVKIEANSNAIALNTKLGIVSSKKKEKNLKGSSKTSDLFAQEQQSLPQQPMLEHKNNTSLHWKSKKNKQNRRTMTSKEKRRDGLFQIQKVPHQTFETFLPLHELWKQYMWEMLCTNHDALKVHPLDYFTTNFADNILRCDLHGCIIKVAKSKCFANVDIEGIIIQETEHSFRIIDRQDNKCKTLLKSPSLFLFELEIPESLRTEKQHSLRCYMVGDHLTFRSFDRESRKLKRREEIYLD